MNAFLIWLSFHRIVFMILMALVFWVAAYGWYFNVQIAGWLRKGQVHSWSVDLAAKTAMSRGKPEA